MKKTVSVFLAVTLCVLQLCACSVDTKVLSQAEPSIRQMMEALAANDVDAAKALLHPNRLDDSTDEALAALAELLDGREISTCVQVSVRVNNSVGTAGQSRTEEGIVQFTFDDWTDLRLSYVYFSNSAGKGFLSFQFLVGVQ